jgi:hypothetical protein
MSRLFGSAMTLSALRGPEGGWQAQLPGDFLPGDVRACRCGACMECLERAGVPVACGRAWDKPGFDRQLALLSK